MSSETIIQSVCEFLVKFPPFDSITSEDLINLAEGIDLEYFEKNDIVFKQGEKPHQHFFMVKKGHINVVQSKDGEDTLLDICDEGDIFGVRASIANDHYIATAKAADDSLLYAIPLEYFKQIIEKNPKVALFLASGFASGISVLREDYVANLQEARKSLQASPSSYQLIEIDSGDTIEVNVDEQQIVSCGPQDSIWQAAKAMSTLGVGSILIVDEARKPMGIVTDTDFRNKVVSQEISVKNEAVKTIMSSPVLTIPNGLAVSEIMLKMVSNRVSHFCVTQDGTAHTQALGIVSQRDLVLAQGNNPAVLAKQIMRSEDIVKISVIRDKAERLVSSYLNQEVGIPFISTIISEINDVLIEQAIKIAQKHLSDKGKEMPPVKFCWFSMGSEGRKEQLLRTDLDNGLIYEDVPESPINRVRDYFLEFSKEVIDILVKTGFEPCPAHMMASNEQWCQPLSNWKKQFAKWVNEPDPKSIMNTTIFFDFRPIAGNFEMADELKQFIFTEIDKQPVFLNFLAKNALQNPPPLSFFRNFIVEKGGDHKNEFDIKARAMMPLADVARVLALDFKIPAYLSTFERFEAVAKLEPNLKAICESAAMAYEILMRHRAINGLKNKNSGRFINPNDFNKLERQVVRNTFKTIEKIQQVLENRYKLGFMR